MAPGVHALLSGTLTFGSGLLFAVRELILLRRDRNGGGWDHAPPVPPQPRLPGSAPERPLPACLVPSSYRNAPPRRELVAHDS